MRRFVLLVMLGMVSMNNNVRAASSDAERGRYVVERVGMCADCHSPRDATGAPVAEMAFNGAPIGFAPIHPIPAWADYAPRLAGLPPGYDTAALVRFLRTGARPDGTMARPPMPPYRLGQEDAEAVAAFFQSLSR